jgi:hypothetical protein
VLLAGVAAFLALVAYVAVAYADTHSTAKVPTVSPYVPSASKLVPVPPGAPRFAVRVTPLAVGNYGALVSTLVYRPRPGRRFVLSLWLRGSPARQISGSRPAGILVSVGEQGMGGTSTRYVVHTTVPAETRWHRFAFSRRVVGRRLSISLYVSRNVYRTIDVARSWFEVRRVRVRFS